MGQDIHCVIERRAAVGEPWRFDRPFLYGYRNYSLFRVIHDMNDLWRKNDPNRDSSGLPSDIDPASDPDDEMDGYPSYLADRFGDHSRGWLTLGEIRSWYGWDDLDPFAEPSQSRRGNCVVLLQWMNAQPADADDLVRIVFGFDS